MSFLIGPDNSRVAFTVETGGPALIELFGAPIDGSSAPVRLHAPFVSGRRVSAFRFGGDAARVVYLADQDQDEVQELFSVPADGSAAPVQLNPLLVTGGDVRPNFRISPDGSRVVYMANQEMSTEIELYSVPIQGGAALQLNGALVLSGGVQSFDNVGDGARVVYLADQNANDDFELFSVPIDASAAPVRLSGPLASGGDVLSNFQIDPTAARVVYVADQDANDVFELYSVPLDASSVPVKLNDALVAGGDIFFDVDWLRISSDGQWVVYVADQVVNEVFEVFSVPIDGSQAPVRLNGAFVPGGDVGMIIDDFSTTLIPPEISPDGARVIYVADQEVNGTLELFSVPIGGGPAVKLNGAALAGEDSPLLLDPSRQRPRRVPTGAHWDPLRAVPRPDRRQPARGPAQRHAAPGWLRRRVLPHQPRRVPGALPGQPGPPGPRALRDRAALRSALRFFVSTPRARRARPREDRRSKRMTRGNPPPSVAVRGASTGQLSSLTGHGVVLSPSAASIR